MEVELEHDRETEQEKETETEAEKASSNHIAERARAVRCTFAVAPVALPAVHVADSTGQCGKKPTTSGTNPY